MALPSNIQIKKYKQMWKANLINSMNPEWKDLSKDWYKPEEIELARKLKIAAQGRDDGSMEFK